MALSLTNLAANTEADALARLLDSGKIKIYSGTVPATADTALGAQVLLGTLTFSATSAPAASEGVLTFDRIENEASAAATAPASFFRATTKAGAVVFQGTVGTAATGDADYLLNSVAVQRGTTIIAAAMRYTVTR